MYGIYILIILFLIVLAQIKSMEADKQAKIASEQQRLTEKRSDITLKEAS